jgi:hypothetical protein
MTHKSPFVLGIHPSSRGFGWALFEGELAPFDWGTADIYRHDSGKVLERVGALLEKYQPCVVVCEEFEAPPARRSARIRGLYRTILAQAAQRDITIYRFRRAEIGAVLAPARTREEIAAVVAKRVPQFRPRLPKKRKVWESEHPSLALFNAVACVLTYYASRRS